MAQFPDCVDAWEPLGNQFIDSASSVALTIPVVPATASNTQPMKGAIYVAILTAQTQAQWIRTDGVTVVAVVTGGVKLFPGDWRLIYGRQTLDNVRVIREAAGGSLACEYFYFRPGS